MVHFLPPITFILKTKPVTYNFYKNISIHMEEETGKIRKKTAK